MEYEYFRRQIRDFLKEHSIAKLLEMVMYEIKYKEEKLTEAANPKDGK